MRISGEACTKQFFMIPGYTAICGPRILWRDKVLPYTNLTVPASEGEITKEWLQAVLAGLFPDVTLTSLEGKRIGQGYCFASSIYRY